MVKRRQPLNWTVVSPTDDGRASHILIIQPDAEIGLLIHDEPMSRDEVRADERQMFVTRDEEDSFVASFHFPVVSGKARQVKIVVPIRQLFQGFVENLPAALPIRDSAELVEQLLVEFEQICANFMIAALPRLRNMALQLTPLTPKRSATSAAQQQPSRSTDDGREEYVVNRSSGWPISRPRFKLHDVVRLPPDLAKRDVDSGYLVRARDVEENITGWGAEYREALNTYRLARDIDAEAVLHRPQPVDMATCLETSKGRNARKKIANDIAKITDLLFTPPVGRPLSRAHDEKAALIAELRQDLNRRRAGYVWRGIRKTIRAVYQEMAEKGRYGPGREALSAANIEYLLKKSRGDKRG